MSNTQDPVKLAIEAIKAALSDDKPYLDLCGRALVALEARLQSPAPQPPGDAREAFEAWANNDFYDGIADVSDTWSKERGLYTDAAHHMAWHAWQAASTQASEPSAAEPAFMVYQGELCYKSDADDQSFGMWCPVTPDYRPPFSDGVNFYTNPAAPARAVEPLTDEQRAAIMKRWHGRNWTAGDIIDAVEAHYLGITTTPAAKAGKDGGV